MDLKIKSIIKKHKNDDEILSNDDTISIFDDLSSIGIKLNENKKIKYVLSDSMRLTLKIEKLHNKKIQSLTYSELPDVLQIIETYIKDNKEN